jgi:cobalt/nickel transport system permease protein
MFDLFSDYFALRSNRLGSLDGRVKLFLSLLAIMAVIVSENIYYPLSVFVFCYFSMFFIKLPLRLLLLRTLPLLVMAMMVLLLKSFLTSGVSVFSFSLGSWEPSATVEGINDGVLIASRILGSMSVVLLLGFTTPVYRLFQSLAWFGIPHTWVEVALLTYRYTFYFLDIAMQVMSAQKVRLGYTGAVASFNSAGLLSGSVLVRAFHQAERTGEAMAARGYDGEFPASPMERPDTKDFVLLFLFASIIVIGFILGRG